MARMPQVVGDGNGRSQGAAQLGCAGALDDDAGFVRDAMLHEAQPSSGTTISPLQAVVCARVRVCVCACIMCVRAKATFQGRKQDEKNRSLLTRQSLLSTRRAQRKLRSKESASFRDGRGSNCIGGLRNSVGSGSLQEGKSESGRGQIGKLTTQRSQRSTTRRLGSHEPEEVGLLGFASRVCSASSLLSPATITTYEVTY